MDKPIKQSKFVPNRSPRQPGSSQTRGRQNIDKLDVACGRRRRKAMGNSNVRLLYHQQKQGCNSNEVPSEHNQSFERHPHSQPQPVALA